MNPNGRKVNSFTECVKFEGGELLINVVRTLHQVKPTTKRKSRRGRMPKAVGDYKLVIRQAEHDLVEGTWTRVDHFPLKGMVIVLRFSEHKVIRDNSGLIANALTRLQSQFSGLKVPGG